MRAELGERIGGEAGTGTEIRPVFEPSDPPAQHATVTCWFLDCPRQSVGWDHFLLSVVHLRTIYGAPPAYRSSPGTTHEVLLVALLREVDPKATDPSSWKFIQPINLSHQVRLPSDDEARELGRMSAVAVVEGRLWAEPPLSGQTEPWASMLEATAAHLRGEHTEEKR
jgi:hypothetical protein